MTMTRTCSLLQRRKLWHLLGLAALILLIVYCHDRQLSLAAFLGKVLDMAGDVVADRWAPDDKL